ncbi:hypothetical protein SERLA73DRAFT_80070 [Serpula lacrymans var. lacrymans S7.3]|uniref:Uncharacterized protein n=2 Tax=Serpula lacrymans var. lacrymans TaxID=341189 RepID=F8QIL3_SERL3|nr:uncharacterized protein SERLADRAFT_437282 [Serpula lacrymans var. lacrymans S7.9]EGN91852.1 hypothetical protein SERLA73DRAFT_80070 [Serpula lacrymans var. lacrymans S7.3]EGO25555.1 hypothetical protein SERLADRAFT_437282 [Serpula lacrymans var. lacrymans S7.9]
MKAPTAKHCLGAVTLSGSEWVYRSAYAPIDALAFEYMQVTVLPAKEKKKEGGPISWRGWRKSLQGRFKITGRQMFGSRDSFSSVTETTTTMEARRTSSAFMNVERDVVQRLIRFAAVKHTTRSYQEVIGKSPRAGCQCKTRIFIDFLGNEVGWSN